MSDDNCLDVANPGGPVNLVRCHGMGGNQAWEYDSQVKEDVFFDWLHNVRIMGLLLLSWQPDNLNEALLVLLLIGLLCCIFYRLPLQSQVCCSPTLTLYQLNVILNTKIIPILKFYLKSLSKLVLCFILFSLIRLIFFNFIKINSFHFIILFKLIRLIFLLLKFNLSHFIYILSYFPTFYPH